jgi:hypothetical protein
MRLTSAGRGPGCPAPGGEGGRKWGYLLRSCIDSGTKTPATHFDASAGDSSGSDAGATTDAGSGAGSNVPIQVPTQVSTQVRMPVQVNVAAIACLHEQKSADICIQQES